MHGKGKHGPEIGMRHGRREIVEILPSERFRMVRVRCECGLVQDIRFVVFLDTDGCRRCTGHNKSHLRTRKSNALRASRTRRIRNTDSATSARVRGDIKLVHDRPIVESLQGVDGQTFPGEGASLLLEE